MAETALVTLFVLEAASLLERAGTLMQLESCGPTFVERAVEQTERTGKNQMLFLRAWGEGLCAAAKWVECMHEAGVIPDEEILKVKQLDIDVAETYLENRELIPA